MLDPAAQSPDVDPGITRGLDGIEEVIAQGETVVAMGETSWRVRATGAVFVTPKVDVAKLRDGRIVWWREFYDTAAIQAASLAADPGAA